MPWFGCLLNNPLLPSTTVIIRSCCWRGKDTSDRVRLGGRGNDGRQGNKYLSDRSCHSRGLLGSRAQRRSQWGPSRGPQLRSQWGPSRGPQLRSQWGPSRATTPIRAGRPAGACHHLPEVPRLAISEASPNRYVVNTLGCRMYPRHSPVATEMTLKSCRRAGHRIQDCVRGACSPHRT